MSTLDIDAEAIRKLADLLKETRLNEIEYVEGEKRIRVSAGMPAATSATPVSTAPTTPGQASHTPGAPIILNGTPVEAPMVGTVYLAPEPGAAPFVKTGDTIKAGDTLLIIEAMKVMNPIKAPAGGTVKEILVGDAKPVEFGETLMVIA
jgi:acetyl-CoA carboxylase biotin carboxyl carrier protein